MKRKDLFYSTAQLGVAKESYGFWRGKGAPHMHGCLLTAGEGGESGFNWKQDTQGKWYTPAGDHGQAKGIFQWWPQRGALVLAKSGFDVRDGTHMDGLQGAFAEMSEAWSPYRHVWEALLAKTTFWSGEDELVRYYEQSANPGSDDLKRTAIALYIDHVAQTEAWG